MTTIIGTSHFVSLKEACRYYADYGVTAENVDHKITAGEIHKWRERCPPRETVEEIEWREAAD